MTTYAPTDPSTLQTAFSDADGDQTFFKTINGVTVDWNAVAYYDMALFGGTLRFFKFAVTNPPVFILPDDGSVGPAPDQTQSTTVAVVISDGSHDTAGTLSVRVYGKPLVAFGFATAPSVTPTGTVTVGQTLTGDPGTIEGGTPPYAVALQWMRDGAAIAGATATTYTTTTADANATDIYLDVTATDATSPTPKTAKARTAGVSASPPPLTSSIPPSINGSPVIGQTLTAVNGTWNGVGPVTFTYQWTNDGVNIGGATGQTLALVAGMEGHSIAVKVTGTDNAAQTLTVASAAVLARLPGVITFETEEAAMLAEFAKHPDNGWPGFADETGFTIITCTHPDQVKTAWDNWRVGSPTTSKVKVLCQWNGLVNAASLRWTGPAATKLTPNPNEFGGYDRPPGGFWMENAPGYAPIWGTRLQISGATRFHCKGVRFAGTRDGLQAAAAPMLYFDYSSSAPGPALIHLENVNVGHKDNRPGAPFSDCTSGIYVKQGAAYSCNYKNVRVAGCWNGIRSYGLYNRGWKTDFHYNVADARSCFGINDARFNGRYIWHHWELTLIRDLRQEASATGQHTDFMQHGGSADTHKGYKTIHKYFLGNMDSHTALDSQTQGFYNDDAVNNQEFNVSVKEGVIAISAYHSFVRYDPSQAGHMRLKRVMFPRASTWGLDKAGLPMDTYQQLLISHGYLNGGSFEAEDVTVARVGGGNVGGAVLTNIRYFNAQKGTPAGRDGLTQATAKRIEEVITGTGGTFTRDGTDLCTYSIPGETNPDFAAAWWALRDFYTPVAGWGTAGVPTDPGTWPGVPPRP